MDSLVIAPTATYHRGPLRKEVNDEIKDSPDAIRIQQKVDSIVPKGSDRTGEDAFAENRIYNDFRPMRRLHQRARERDLEVYELDALYEKRPMYNISFPDMKLRKQV